MKLEQYVSRGLNLDSLIYELDVNYAPTKVNEQESIKFTCFQVFQCADIKSYKFVANGEYTSKKHKDKEFSLCVEEMSFKDYQTKTTAFIEHVFFTNRSSVVALVQASFNGNVKMVAPEPVVIEELVEEETNLVPLSFDDSFTEEAFEMTVVHNSDLEVAVADKDPIIILDKKLGGRPKGAVAKKKVVARKK